MRSHIKSPPTKDLLLDISTPPLGRKVLKGGLNNISSEYLISMNGFGDSPLANDSLFDLFPGLATNTKKDDIKMKSPRSQPNSHRAIFSSGETISKHVSMKDIQSNDSGAVRPSSAVLSVFKIENGDRSANVFGSNNSTDSSNNNNNKSNANSNNDTSNNGNDISTKNTQKQMRHSIEKPFPIDTSMFSHDISAQITYSPKSDADQMALKLAQYAIDLSTLPKRVKMLRNLSDEVIQTITDMTNPMEGVILNDDIARNNNNIYALAGSLMSGTCPPLKYLVFNALTSPTPRSVGTPTNVSVPTDKEIDGKTLKRLRNRISAGRCRLRKRVWTMGLEKCDKELQLLSEDLKLYVEKLEKERNSMLQLLSIAEKK